MTFQTSDVPTSDFLIWNSGVEQNLLFDCCLLFFFETSTFANCLPRKNLFERFMASNTSSASIENIYARSLAESFVRIFREHMFPKKNDSSREVHKGLNDVSGVEYAWFEINSALQSKNFREKKWLLSIVIFVTFLKAFLLRFIVVLLRQMTNENR